MRYLFSDNSHEIEEDETLIVLTPHILRMPTLSAQNLQPMAAGSDSNVRVYRESASVEGVGGSPGIPLPAQAAVQPSRTLPPPMQAGLAPTSLSQPAPQAAAPPPSAAVQSQAAAAPQPPPAGAAVQLHFEPATTTLRVGDKSTLGLAISNVNDLYSIPLMIHYNPAVIQVEEVRNGGFLSGGTQEIAIVQRTDAQRGEVVVSATRQPNTPGVSGTGTVLGFVIRAVGPGTAKLQILQVNARNSEQQAIPVVSEEATIQVQ
jgi:hypothetical protein